MSRWTRRKMSDGAALCVELGAGLLENGAETSRVEETIRMAGQALRIEVEVVVHPTGITVGFGQGEAVTRVARIKNRSIDLNKVADLNRLSRALCSKEIGLEECRREVKSVRTSPSLYTPAQLMVATAVSCACLTAAVGGGWEEAVLGMVAGCAGTWMLERIGSNFPSFLSLFAMGFLSCLFGILGKLQGLSAEPIVVGSLLNQMPGLAFVSAMRDLMAGELVAGNARLAEALLVTLGMASGVLACLSLALRLGVSG